MAVLGFRSFGLQLLKENTWKCSLIGCSLIIKSQYELSLAALSDIPRG